MKVLVVGVDVEGHVLGGCRFQPTLSVTRRVACPVADHSRVVTLEVALSALGREHRSHSSRDGLRVIIVREAQGLLSNMVKQPGGLRVRGKLEQSLPAAGEETHPRKTMCTEAEKNRGELFRTGDGSRSVRGHSAFILCGAFAAVVRRGSPS